MTVVIDMGPAIAAAELVLKKGIDDIVALAKLQCPHNTGALEASIRAEGQGLHYTVTFGGPETSSYEDLIHENYESIRPGPNTLAKMAANPEIVIGSHFLTRAADALVPGIQAAVAAAVEQAMQGGKP